MRDEGPWLLDWIAHHRAHGFDHFLIASHDCLDGTDTLLDALDAAGIVTHVPFTPKGDKAVQWQALKLLSKHPLYTSADMALFFDVDEYLVLKDGATLAQLLPADMDAVPLRWRLFGNSGHALWEDRPVTQRFTHAAPVNAPLTLGHLFKTLHRPSAFNGLGVHRPKGKDAVWCLTSPLDAPPQLSSMQALIHLLGVPQQNEVAWLNHYSVRSIEEFILKSKRGLPNHTEKSVDAGYWVQRNFNSVEETSIAPMGEAAQKSRDELSGFNELHAQSVAYHKARLKTLLEDREIVDLFWQCELTPTSIPPSASRFRAHVTMLSAAMQRDTQKKKGNSQADG